MSESSDSFAKEIQMVRQVVESKKMILVVGLTGSGKSSFINTLPRVGNVDAVVGHELDSCTVNCASFIGRLGGTDVILTDTPGFDDSTDGVTDADILEEIARVLTKQYEAGAKLKGIVYLQRITDIRIGGSGRRALKIFKEICGNDALSNVVLATTRWSEVDEQVGIAREKQLREKHWFYLLDKGARMQRYYGTKDSAVGIITELLGKSDVVLDIQRQIVDEGKTLGKTSAGTLVSDNLAHLQAELSEGLDEIERLRRDLSEADEAMRIRTEEDLKRERKKLQQAHAAEAKLREDVRAEVRAELEAETKKTGKSKGRVTAARIALSGVSAAVDIISFIFGLDPSLAHTVSGWFGGFGGGGNNDF